jgi:Protein kinase domain
MYRRVFASSSRCFSAFAPAILYVHLTTEDGTEEQDLGAGESFHNHRCHTDRWADTLSPPIRKSTMTTHSTLCEPPIKQSPSSKTDFNRRYTLQTPPLGRGTFGTVYRGVDHTTGQPVAVKRMVTQKDHAEVQALLHLDRAGGHPNICSLVEYYHDDKQSFLVMELVEGCEMFDHLVQQGAYSEFDAARLVREVGSALAFLHGLGMVHMDLKPENIMLSSMNPSNAVVKLIDFGCAVITNNKKSSTLTASLAGRTLAYCPPEVLEGDVTAVSPSADMFALGTYKVWHGRRRH